MYRGRYWGFANDFFAQFSKVCRLTQEFVLLIIEKHNGFILFYLCVDHKDPVRRSDEISPYTYRWQSEKSDTLPKNTLSDALYIYYGKIFQSV